MLVTPRGLEAELPEGELLKGEQADLAGLVRRQEGLGADGGEVAAEILAAGDAAPAVPAPTIITRKVGKARKRMSTARCR